MAHSISLKSSVRAEQNLCFNNSIIKDKIGPLKYFKTPMVFVAVSHKCVCVCVCVCVCQ